MVLVKPRRSTQKGMSGSTSLHGRAGGNTFNVHGLFLLRWTGWRRSEENSKGRKCKSEVAHGGRISLTGPLVLIRLVEDRGVEIRSQGDFYGNDTHAPEQAIGRVDLDRAGDAAGFC